MNKPVEEDHLCNLNVDDQSKHSDPGVFGEGGKNNTNTSPTHQRRRMAHGRLLRRKVGLRNSHNRLKRWFIMNKKRVTNSLSVFVLALMVSIHLYFRYRRLERSPMGVGAKSTSSAAAAAAHSSWLTSTQQRRNNLRGKPREWITAETQPFNQDRLASRAKNLIIVAGHSVIVSGHLEDADQDESDWFLLDYQKHRGLPTAIVLHIQAGIDAAYQDPQSLLIFSGGETRAQIGPNTEGSSYYHVADAMGLWALASPRSRTNSTTTAAGQAAAAAAGGTIKNTVRARTITEEFATDSFENLMFSICRFHEITDRYPEKITIVSFTFKEIRFRTLHAPALRWPGDQFDYIGVDPPAETGFDLVESKKGEFENAAKPFETDPYGCHTPVLQTKRRERNPFSRTAPYALTCPDMKELLNYCGTELIPVDQVPWRTASTTV